MAVRHTEAIAEDVERVLGAVLPAIDVVDVRVVPGGVLRVLIDHRLHAPLEGRRRFRGELLESDAQRVVVRDTDGAFEIPFAAISRAHLVEEL